MLTQSFSPCLYVYSLYSFTQINMIQATIAKLSIAIAPKRLHVSFNRNRQRVRGIESLRTLKNVVKWLIKRAYHIAKLPGKMQGIR